MKKHIRLFMVDDHPFILSAYKNTVDRFKPDEYTVSHIEAANANEAITAIQNNSNFDVAFLDISIPESTEFQVYSGLDLANILQEKMPECKIVLLTMHTEKVRFQEVIDTVNPAGLIIKNDLTFEELLNAFDHILRDKNYYSESVLKIIEENNTSNS